MKKGFLKSATTAVLSVCIGILPLAGCRPDTPDTENFLEVFCWEAGYGTEWCEALLADFVQQDWVKEKYPGVDYDFSSNNIETYSTEIVQQPSANTVDLFFGSKLYTVNDRKVNSQPIWADLQDVYDSVVPGEEITVEEKIYDSYNNSNLYYDPAARENHYYQMSWVSGMQSFLYNEDLLEEMGLEVPLTTDKMIELCETVKNTDYAGYPYDYSLICSTKVDYWRSAFTTWWAQYQGEDEYYDYFNGVVDNVRSKDVLKQQGRLESLMVVDTLLNGKNGYMCPNSSIYEFMEAQTNFLMGQGLFMWMGDWFDSEMATIADSLANRGYDYTFRFMKPPVISAIVDKTPSVKERAAELGISDDDMLAAIVLAVDEGASSVDGIDPQDFKIIRDARSVMTSLGGHHNASIPSYATAVDLAKDFLRYMATDRANEIFIRVTNGSAMPFRYDLQEKDPELYAAISPMKKDMMEFYNDAVNPIQVLRIEQSFRLCSLGNFTALHETGSSTLEAYFSDASSDHSGEQLYLADIAYWTESRWQMALSMAGM